MQGRRVNTREVGKQSEEVACRFLQKKGYRILTTNYRQRFGEIDIIAEKGEQLVFVEVRSLHGSERLQPEETVGVPKQLRLSRTAMAYIQQHGLEDRPARFDIVSIDMSADRPFCRHIEDAFEALES
jgi:putative endonuclease